MIHKTTDLPFHIGLFYGWVLQDSKTEELFQICGQATNTEVWGLGLVLKHECSQDVCGRMLFGDLFFLCVHTLPRFVILCVFKEALGCSWAWWLWQLTVISLLCSVSQLLVGFIPYHSLSDALPGFEPFTTLAASIGILVCFFQSPVASWWGH